MSYYSYERKRIPIEKKPVYKYPLVMKGTLSGVVINMIAESEGTVIGVGQRDIHRRPYTTGEYRSDWCMNNFKPFEPVMGKTKE